LRFKSTSACFTVCGGCGFNTLMRRIYEEGSELQIHAIFGRR
jgi:hypothetical protein